MKAILCLLALFIALPCFADTYSGVVWNVKHFNKGGVAVDLDGAYPQQKMTLYVPASSEDAVGTLPKEGDHITATGAVVQYKGRPEIKILSADQWKFHE
jgi:hypothetical protein